VITNFHTSIIGKWVGKFKLPYMGILNCQKWGKFNCRLHRFWQKFIRHLQLTRTCNRKDAVKALEEAYIEAFPNGKVGGLVLRTDK
jgi:hypothetical protein